MIVGRKRLPDVDQHEKYWAIVDFVTSDLAELQKKLKESIYPTKTRGARKLPQSRPCGEGFYNIIHSKKATYFAYHLETPTRLHKIQKKFNILPEANYILPIKNKSNNIKKENSFERKSKFMPLMSSESLNKINTELLLIAVNAETSFEFNTDIPSRKNLNQANIFTDLKLRHDEYTIKPLLSEELI